MGGCSFQWNSRYNYNILRSVEPVNGGSTVWASDWGFDEFVGLGVVGGDVECEWDSSIVKYE
jgi:hypothetical protein